MSFSIEKLKYIFRRRKEDGTFCKIGINIIDDIEDQKTIAVKHNSETNVFECGVYQKDEKGEPKFIETVWL